ncbi:hypothetical protein [Thalassoroseus pseudoceratinae]|uniref:hypothetical protein n=1 Tax=Thalassoroseus pseudoceratinae TaxID=2713176 RepID=UPI0014244C4A|nr:hypothetical protein [Thalassoroseus pseudoceratinae]
MHTFFEHVRIVRLAEQLYLLGENVYDLDFDAYDQLFATELKRLAMQVRHPATRAQLEDMAEKFKFSRYIATSVRRAGFSDEQEVNQITHDIASTLLLGKLFEFDPAEIPFAARFKTSVANAIRNVVAKQRNQRRLIPSVPISDEPGIGIPSSELAGRNLAGADEGLIDDFGDLVHQRLGALGSAVLRAKLDGDEVKGLVGAVELDDPSSYRIKQVVIAIKQLAKEFARQRGDEDFEQRIERAMDAERRTVEKRFGPARNSRT